MRSWEVTSLSNGRKVALEMSDAEVICMLTQDIQKLICTNITAQGKCRFDCARVRMVLEFTILEIQKSLFKETTETD